MNALVQFSIQLASQSVPVFLTTDHSVNALADQTLASDALLAELHQKILQPAAQNLISFLQLIQLAEQTVYAFRSDYFEIDEDYTDAVIMGKISLAVGFLSKIACDCTCALHVKLQKLEDERSELVGKKANIYSQITGTTGEYNHCMNRIHALHSKRLQIEKDKEEYSLEAAKEREKLSEIEQKKRSLEKWCWVPLYGVYLYADLLHAQSGITGIMQKLHTAEQNIHTLLLEEAGLLQELQDLSGNESTLDKHIFLIEQALYECMDDMNFTSAQVIQYAEITLFFGKIAAQLKYPDCDSRLVLSCLAGIRVDIGSLFEKGAIAERCTRFIADLNYRSNRIYSGDRLSKGEYLASLSRQYVAAMCTDGMLRIYNTETCIGAFGTNTIQKIFSGKNGCLDRGKLCIMDSGELVCISPGESEDFDGNITARYSPDKKWISTNSSFFKIKSYNYSGTYILRNKNGLVLDVAFNSQYDNAAIITYPYHGGNNQQFIIERLPDLTYKILAVHSRKALTLDCHNRIVQTTWEAADNQKWLIIGNDDRIVKLINIQNSKAVDIPNNSSEQSTAMWTYPDNGTSAQRFVLARA